MWPYVKNFDILKTPLEPDRDVWVDPNHTDIYFTAPLSAQESATYYGWKGNWGQSMPFGYNGYNQTGPQYSWFYTPTYPSEGVNRRATTEVARPAQVLLFAHSLGPRGAFYAIGFLINWTPDSSAGNYFPITDFYNGGAASTYCDGHAKYIKQSWAHSNAQEPTETNTNSIWSIR